jgi:transcriptional regulator with XRE-family HTH domain
VNDLIEGLKKTLKNEEARHVYADTVVNSLVSAQIKALREDRELSQQELADLIGTKQSGISRLEKADYSTWKIETLRKLARAFGVRLRINFDEFGTLPPDLRGFTKKKLCPRSFEDDPVFKDHVEDRVSEGKRHKAANMFASTATNPTASIHYSDPTERHAQMETSPSGRDVGMASGAIQEEFADKPLAKAS